MSTDVPGDLYDLIVQLMYPPAGSGNYWEAFTGAIKRVQYYYLENNDWNNWTPEMQELAKACWLILGIKWESNLNKQEFLNSMIDFESTRTMTDAELSVWAQEKWAQLKKNGYGEESGSRDYIRLFVRYFGEYVPELNGKPTDQFG